MRGGGLNVGCGGNGFTDSSRLVADDGGGRGKDLLGGGKSRSVTRRFRGRVIAKLGQVAKRMSQVYELTFVESSQTTAFRRYITVVAQNLPTWASADLATLVGGRPLL